jgi:hypothetical protein
MLPCLIWLLRMASGVLLPMRRGLLRRRCSAATPGCMLGSGPAPPSAASYGPPGRRQQWQHYAGLVAPFTLGQQRRSGQQISGPMCQHRPPFHRRHRQRCWQL